MRGGKCNDLWTALRGTLRSDYMLLLGHRGGEPHRPIAHHSMTATIARILDITADRARLVRGYLQMEYRTLDSLSAAQIKRGYREIGPTIDADPVMAERIAQSFGI